MADLRVTRQVVEVLAEDPLPEPTLRVTRQAVEVLAADPPPLPTLRITRQAVEVVAADPPPGELFADATSDLVISQSASCLLDAPTRTAYSALSLATGSTVSIAARRSASSFLVLVGDAGVRVTFCVQASSILSLGDLAVRTIDRAAHCELSLAQQAIVAAAHQVSAGHDLGLSGWAAGLRVPAIETTSQTSLELWVAAEGRNTMSYVEGQNALDLGISGYCSRNTQVAAVTPIFFTEITLDRLTFDEIAVEHGLVPSASAYVYANPGPIENILSFAQEAGIVRIRADGISVAASCALTLSQSGWPTSTGDASDELTLGQSASAAAGKIATIAFALDQQASRTIKRFVSAGSTLGLHQAFNVVQAKGCIPKWYTPFVGSTDDPRAPAPPSTIAPTLERAAGVELYWPTDAPTMTIFLRGPELDNKDRLRFQRINRETRGGTLIVLADPIWPRVQQMTLEFAGLKEDEAQSLLSFIAATLGKEIGLRDWENRHWAGVLISPDEPIIRNGQHNISATLEFEGTPL